MGERHHKARLPDAEVVRMRRMYEGWKAQGYEDKGYGALSYLFNTPWPTCRDIVTYRTRINAQRAE